MTDREQQDILFLPLSKGNLLEMLPIAEVLKKVNGLRPVFCLCSKVMPCRELVKSFDVVRSDGSPLPPLNNPIHRNRDGEIPANESSKEKIFSLMPPLFRYLLLLRSEKWRAKKLLSRFPYARLIVVAGDRSIGIETAVIAEGNKKGILSLIVPFAMSFPESAAEPRLRSGKNGGQHAVDTVLKHLLRAMFPSWVLLYKGTPLFFQPPYQALAAMLLGIMPQKPWIIGGGAATKMAVESSALRNQLLRQGMRPEKMIVTGKPSLDIIAAQLAAVKSSEVRERLCIAPHEKIILCSVPNFGEHDLLPWERHRTEMRYLFTTLTATGARVLLSLHPRSDRQWYQPLADATGAQIVEERIYTLMPVCDLLISSYSSTIAQAIALNKPSIVIDFYGFDYPIYNDAKGAIVMKEKDNFLPLLKRLLENSEYYSSLVQEMKQQANAWAMLDGKNTERVLALIQELIG